MKVKSISEGENNPLWSWHVNIFYLNNQKHIIFVNDLTRLSVIIDGVRTGQLKLLQEKFIDTLETYLKHEGISVAEIEKYLGHGNEICITKTNSRSVLGTMKEITIFNSDDFDNNLDRLKWLNRLIHTPLGIEYPIEAFKRGLKQT